VNVHRLPDSTIVPRVLGLDFDVDDCISELTKAYDKLKLKKGTISMKLQQLEEEKTKHMEILDSPEKLGTRLFQFSLGNAHEEGFLHRLPL
jgi:hypothetical protein